MTLPNTDINLRQHGMLRIEITAIVMLLTALAIVLIENMLPEHQADMEKTAVAAQVLPATNVATKILVDGTAGDMTLGDTPLDNNQSSLLPAAWQASETP